ncbi:MAG: DUF1080 domain-containing protein [Verrucomicrobia bacterium]|nr:DUF1080 domain-containing protein [Verrucomicrobiota bacterium]
MTRTTILSLIACAACSTAACAADLPLKSHPDSASWENLFAPDLSNAIFPKGIWWVENGELTASQDQCIWTAKQHENFVVDLEFKNGPAANSGVIIYTSDLKNWIPNSIEIQILDDYAEKWTKAPKTWLCGGLFGRLAPSKQAVKKAGEWNRMTIAAKGPLICVLLNGQLVAQADIKQWTSATKNPDGSDIPKWLSRPMADLPTKGHIGLQGKHGGAPIFFRNVKIKPLE